MMDTADQKVWFITGTSKGIGLQLTKLLLSKGHKVIATSRTTGVLEKEISAFRDKPE